MLFHSVTAGIRVTVTPRYLSPESDPSGGRYVFAYRVRIENVGDLPATLRWRHWYIDDPAVGRSEVQGEGVIGEQPLIQPGAVHEYESFCVLGAPGGSMEGYYRMERPDGSMIDVVIPSFPLVLPSAAREDS
jgi:ApaG protein